MAAHECFHCGAPCDCGSGYDECDGCTDCNESNFAEDDYDRCSDYDDMYYDDHYWDDQDDNDSVID